MDTFTATLRVRPEGENSARPTRDRVQEAAEALRQRGFDVFHLGRFGVSVRGESPLFEREFGVHLLKDRATVAELELHNSTLAGLVDLLEVAPPAQLFGRKTANAG